MYSLIQNLFAAATFAFITMVGFDRCAGQQASGANQRTRIAAPLTGLSGSLRQAAPGRLGNGFLPDLRTEQTEATVIETKAEKLQVERPLSPAPLTPEPHTANSFSGAQQLRVAGRSSTVGEPMACGQRSFFESDQSSPVVFVLLNPDLETTLLSETQLKHWMQANPEFDHAPPAEINTWQPGAGARVRPVSYSEPAPKMPRGFAGSTQQIESFASRLTEISGRLESKQEQIAADEGGDQGSNSELSHHLNLASDWVARARADLKKLEAENLNENEFEDVVLKEQKRRLAEEKEEDGSEISNLLNSLSSDRSEAIAAIQKKLKEDELTLQSSTDEESRIRGQISAREQRVTDLPRLLSENARAEDKTKQLMEAFKGQSEGLDRSLQKLRFDAEFLSLEITEKALKLDSRRQEQIGRLLPLKLEEVTLRIKRMKDELSRLSQRSDILRDQELNEKRKAALSALNEKLTQSTPQLKELAEFNIDLVSQKTELAHKNDELETELINVGQLQKDLDRSHERIKDQIITLGPTASGIRLIEHRRSLISTGKSQNRLLVLKDRLQHKQTRKLGLKDRVDQLVLGDQFELDVLAAVEEQVFDDRLSPKDNDDQREIAFNVAGQLLETQKKYATDLVDVFEDNITKLAQLEAAHKALIEKVMEVKKFSDENALWVRSSKPIEINDLKLCQAGLKSVVTSDQWQNLRNHTYQTFKNRPYDAGLLAFVIGSLLVVRRRLRWSHE